MQPKTVDLFRSAAWSWGDNSFGASGLTLHSRASWPLPTPVELTKGNVSFLALGVGHTLAVTKRGHAYSWGRNEVGQLGVGDASRTTRALPSWVPLHSPVAMVAAGARHSVALLQDGSVYAWGANDCGQLGTGEMPGATATATFGRRRGAYATMRPLLSEQQARWPRRVPKLPNAKGGRVYACYDRTYVVTSGGAAYGWGDNYGGVVGPQPNTTTKWSGARWWEPTEEPPEPPYVAEPTELRKSIGGGAPVAQVACGYVHTVLVLKGGEVHAWGNHQHGESGVGAGAGEAMSSVGGKWVLPARAAKLDLEKAGCTGAAAAAAGLSHSLLLCGGSSVFAFGLNDRGQLGTGPAPPPPPPPPARRRRRRPRKGRAAAAAARRWARRWHTLRRTSRWKWRRCPGSAWRRSQRGASTRWR